MHYPVPSEVKASKEPERKSGVVMILSCTQAMNRVIQDQ